MKVWKLSLGTGEFNDIVYKEMLKSNVVSVHPETKAKGQSSKSQGENFLEAKKGDLFFLCRSNNSIELIGMFKDNFPLEAIDNNYAHDGWVDREFILINKATDSKGYNKKFVDSNGKQPWWHPGDNSTFIEVKDLKLFGNEVLKPVFNGLSIQELIHASRNKLKSLNMTAYKLQKLQKKFQKIYGKHNIQALIDTINRIEVIDIKKLLFHYKNIENIENNPVVLLRKKILEYILIHNNIDIETINQIKNDLDKKYKKDVYIRWSLFSILYPLFYFKYKDDVVAYLNRLVLLIRKKLKIEDFTSYTKPFHFDGANNFGKDIVWFAIYNTTYPSQKHAYQLLFSLENGKFKYGLFHNDKKNEDKRVERESLCFKDLIDTYQEYINIIKNDNSKEKAMLAEKTNLLECQKQIILQGPPGTGKTRLAKQIANFMINGEVDPKIDGIKDQVKLIQFHPSYSYEDFVRGIVAKSNGVKIEYKTENKILAEMAKQANEDLEKNGENANQYILIIDEINRANLSSVLGELIYALEYRDEAVESMYTLDDGTRDITLPSNLYIIGTMNTADRSVGHIDYAIRRRFAFEDVLPDISKINLEEGKNLFNKVEGIFQEISPDFNKEDVMLGHSYFIAENLEELEKKLEYQIEPLLKEYIKDGVLNENAKEKIDGLRTESDS